MAISKASLTEKIDPLCSLWFRGFFGLHRCRRRNSCRWRIDRCHSIGQLPLEVKHLPGVKTGWFAPFCPYSLVWRWRGLKSQNDKCIWMSLVQECGAATLEFGGGMWWKLVQEDPRSRLPKKCEEDHVKPKDSRCSGSSLSGHHLDLAWLSCCDVQTNSSGQWSRSRLKVKEHLNTGKKLRSATGCRRDFVWQLWRLGQKWIESPRSVAQPLKSAAHWVMWGCKLD